MAGTKAGGAKAAATNKRKYGDDFYGRIGAIGGKSGRTGGFYANRELAREAGRKGGLKSRRGPSKRSEYTQAHTEFQEGFNRPGILKNLLKRGN